MLWTQLPLALMDNNVGSHLARYLVRDFDKPPAPTALNLWRKPLDHVALALECGDELELLDRRLCSAGLAHLEPLHVWPTDVPGCPVVDWRDEKIMVSYRLASTRLVLLAPCRETDVIDTFVQANGGPGLHHLAFTVPSIEAELHSLRDGIPAVRQITKVVRDWGRMSQVFLKQDPDVRMIELVERWRDFDATFTCNNVTGLTHGERVYAFSDEEAA